MEDPPLSDTTNDIDDTANRYSRKCRFEIWRNTLRLIRRHLKIGIADSEALNKFAK